MKRIFCILLVLMLLCGCSKKGTPTFSTEPTNSPNTTSGAQADADFSKTDDDMFTERDQRTDYDADKCVTISLNGTSVSASSNSVKISGTTVTITEEATYLISGTLNDGMLIVNAPDSAKLQLVFDGVSITSSTSAALYILEADKVFLTLADGTENTLASGESFTAIDDNNIDGAVFSKQDLTINGSGNLTVTSPAGHGIVCKDDLVITGGVYAVNAASHGIDANDSIRITGAEMTIDAGKDGIHAENSDDTSLGYIYTTNCTLTIEAEGDGISAGHYIQIESGTYSLVCGGGSENGDKASSGSYGDFGGMGGRPGRSTGSTTTTDSTSMKGIKAGTGILISDGSIAIDSADDALHCATELIINGGKLVLKSGDDGIHSDNTLTITNGTIQITESYEGLEAFKIYVAGGDISLVASDDGLNAAGGTDSSGTGGRDEKFGGMGGGMSSNSNGYIEISGGNLYVKASGDGIDANGSLAITGGYTVVCGPTSGDTAVLDYDKTATISGGTFIGTGAYTMAQTLTGSGQGVMSLRGSLAAGTTIAMLNASNKTIIEFTPELAFQFIVISSPDIIAGQSYTITVGGENAGTFEAS